jgi:hypothetical protein
MVRPQRPQILGERDSASGDEVPRARRGIDCLADVIQYGVRPIGESANDAAKIVTEPNHSRRDA